MKLKCMEMHAYKISMHVNECMWVITFRFVFVFHTLSLTIWPVYVLFWAYKYPIQPNYIQLQPRSCLLDDNSQGCSILNYKNLFDPNRHTVSLTIVQLLTTVAWQLGFNWTSKKGFRLRKRRAYPVSYQCKWIVKWI